MASAHPLASVAGMRVLQAGGNAVDAAVATAAALNVAEPYMSGMGGCGYMMLYTASDRKLQVLDYIGPSSRNARVEGFENPGEKDYGPKAPLVPSALAGWLTAHEQYGSLDLGSVFEPAIEYATIGVPLTVKNAFYYGYAFDAGNLTDRTKSVFMTGNRAPVAGEVVKQEALAATLQTIVRDGQETFYRGALAERIVAAIGEAGGHIDAADLAEYRPIWKTPASTEYRGYTVASPPPPCSGWEYLSSLNVLEGFDLKSMGPSSADRLHTLAETFKLSVADRIAYTTNPRLDLDAVLSDEYAAERRALIDPSRAGISEGDRYRGPRTDEMVPPGEPSRVLKECTTHFDVVDAEGNAVAVTQSLGDGFGSGFMAGDTGVMLNNFGYWFDFDQESPNAIGPGKQIEMCMAPAAVTRGDELFMVIGTPGSFGILQTTPQMITNVLDFEYSIQAAIEAPRIKSIGGTSLEIETRVPEDIRNDLAARGHDLKPLGDWSHMVGGGQGIMIDPDSGVYMGGADPRRDGYALAW